MVARKKFNTAGTCFPDRHYMVDISGRLERIRGLIGDGSYFCINRGRQYGKSTTFEALPEFLKDEYTVFQISFEDLAQSAYDSLETVLAAFCRKLAWAVKYYRGFSLCAESAAIFAKLDFRSRNAVSADDFSEFVVEFCATNDKPVVILIDEVDQAGNNDSFIKFLATLRNMYLARAKVPTFQSVVLAGVSP